MRLVVIVALLGAAIPARAEDTDIYRLNPVVDGALLGLAATMSAAWVLRKDSAPAYCSPDCSPLVGNLSSFDRVAAGNWSPAWGYTSDGVYFASLAAAVGVALWDNGGLRESIETLVVMFEAVLLTNALVIFTQSAAARPRPFMYGLEAPLDERESGGSDMSFQSGHVSGAFAFVTVLFDAMRRRGHDAMSWWVAGAGVAAAAVVATGRVMAGQHFPTDVLLSAVTGTAVGLLVTQAHALPVTPAASITPDGASLALIARF